MPLPRGVATNMPLHPCDCCFPSIARVFDWKCWITDMISCDMNCLIWRWRHRDPECSLNSSRQAAGEPEKALGSGLEGLGFHVIIVTKYKKYSSRLHWKHQTLAPGPGDENGKTREAMMYERRRKLVGNRHSDRDREIR